MKKNSNFAYLIFHPEYLVDLLRAGGRFPLRQSFSIPSSDSTFDEIGEFVDKQLPSLSEERYEIWLKFRLPDDPSISSFSLDNIVSSHFYNKHRQQATSGGVIQTLAVYGIPLLEPLEDQIAHVLEIYDSKVREHAANFIVRTWFPKIQISEDFISQLKVGYKYQQSPSPENLTPIPSELIWAHLVAYNHGLRKFDERPLVLWLQDIQEVFKRNDSDFKQKLKSLGENYNSKYSDILDDAEKSRKNGVESSRWVLEGKKKTNSYFSELDKYLSKLGSQQSFFYSALFYFNWRETVLNSDYSGRLSDHKGISYFLNSNSENPMNQAIAEALFTIIYAGGPRVFQKALIEARMKVLGIDESKTSAKPKTSTNPTQPSNKPFSKGLFKDFKKIIAEIFSKAYDRFSASKKKEIQKDIKEIKSTITKIKKGEFDHDQYLALCLLLEIQAESFDDYPVLIEAKAGDRTDQSESVEKLGELPPNKEEQTTVSEQRDTNDYSVNESEAPALGNDDSSDDIKEELLYNESQVKTKKDSTLDQPESATSESESSVGTQEVKSIGELKDANGDSVNESEASAIENDDASGDTKDDHVSNENQEEIKPDSTIDKSESVGLGSELSIGEEKVSFGEEQKDSIEDSVNEFEAPPSGNNDASDNNPSEDPIDTKDKFSDIAEVSDEINKRGNEISDGTSSSKEKSENQSKGNQEKPTSPTKPGTLPIDFPE